MDPSFIDTTILLNYSLKTRRFMLYNADVCVYVCVRACVRVRVRVRVRDYERGGLAYTSI